VVLLADSLEPSLVDHGLHRGRVAFRVVDWSRTSTDLILNRMPLPLGYDDMMSALYAIVTASRKLSSRLCMNTRLRAASSARAKSTRVGFLLLAACRRLDSNQQPTRSERAASTEGLGYVGEKRKRKVDKGRHYGRAAGGSRTRTGWPLRPLPPAIGLPRQMPANGFEPSTREV
jgi:hypothetical protein